MHAAVFGVKLAVTDGVGDGDGDLVPLCDAVMVMDDEGVPLCDAAIVVDDDMDAPGEAVVEGVAVRVGVVDCVGDADGVIDGVAVTVVVAVAVAGALSLPIELSELLPERDPIIESLACDEADMVDEIDTLTNAVEVLEGDTIALADVDGMVEAVGRVDGEFDDEADAVRLGHGQRMS